jgi:ribosomal protein S18 acetylase RimI-like enzyme
MRVPDQTPASPERGYPNRGENVAVRAREGGGEERCFVRPEKIVCWEATDTADPVTRAAGRLYEQTLDADERIPWAWIERAVEGRSAAKPGSWSKHLLLAAPESRAGDPDGLAGYAFGSFIPGYGGYLCYLGVAEWARRLGIGTRLYEEFYRVVAADARSVGEPLPFVVWESHRPEPDAPPAAWDLWAARVRLFDRVGGLWVEGVDFLSPNFRDEDGPPVPLKLFVKPMDLPASAFDAELLRRVAGGLHERVYRNQPGEALYDGTLPPGCRPRLVPARLAAVREERGVLV